MNLVMPKAAAKHELLFQKTRFWTWRKEANVEDLCNFLIGLQVSAVNSFIALVPWIVPRPSGKLWSEAEHILPRSASNVIKLFLV
jgi:hypothetical protein